MKPKTKLQKKVVKLSAKVPEVSEKDKQWANEALFDGYYVRVRNRDYCLECGHKWEPGEEAELSYAAIAPDCPSCGAGNLESIHDWSVDKSVYEYWAIIDVVEGFQLVRMFFVEKYLKRKQPAQYWHREVMQHWIREDGKLTTLSMLAGGMGTYNYYDSWSSGSDLEPRTNSRNHRLRQSIIPYKIRPGRNTLPIIRRNGYNGYFKDQAPHQFFSAILKHPKAETLLKAGQISLFKKCVGEEGMHEDIETYWDSICIAMRNDYLVEDAGDWLDYLGFLDELDKDLHNPHYVCPEKFKEEHDRYYEKIREIREKEREEERRQKMLEDQAKYVESKGMFFDLEIEAGEFTIRPLKSIQEFIEEGKKLHHCIDASRYYRRETSLILSARIDGEPVETIEVDLEELKVAQARGLQNKATEHHETIVNAVEDNMRKIASIVSKHNVAAMVADIEGEEREVAA